MIFLAVRSIDYRGRIVQTIYILNGVDISKCNLRYTSLLKMCLLHNLVKSRPCISLFHFDYRPTKNVSLAQNSCEVNSLLFLCFVLITGHTHTHIASALLCFYFLVFEIVFLFFFLFFFPSTESQEVLTS